jgi:[ribosomal protein S5]-alanine N-acetyltransferase
VRKEDKGEIDMEHPFLVGRDVYLRGLMKSDIEGPWFDWFNDQENTFFMFNGTYPVSYESHLDFYQQVIQSRDNLVLGICEKDNDRHIGNVGLHNINWLYRRAELGIIIGDRKAQGKGMANEAMRLLIGHGFSRLNLHKIFLRAEEGNSAALKAFERIGFKVEGNLREEIRHHGKWRDSIYMGILGTEFHEKRPEKEGSNT